MNQEKYNFFKKEQLPIFKAIYKNAGAYRKKELKRSLFENKNLTEKQKEDFWNLVCEKENN